MNAADIENSLPPHSAKKAHLLEAVSPNSLAPLPSCLQRFDPLMGPTWDQTLDSCSNRSFFYSSAWARVLHDSYGYHPLYFIDRQSAPFAFPWMIVKSWLTGSRAVSLPFTDSCATDGISPVALRRVSQEIIRLGAARRWKYWEFRGGAELLTDISPSTQFLRHQLRLGRSDDEMFSRFYSATRTAVRKAEAAGIHVEISRDLEAVKSFYELLCRTRRRHGTPPQPFAFFANLHRHTLKKDLGFIALAHKDGQPAAGIFFLQHDAMAIYKYAASDERLQQFRASNLVLWRGIQHLIQRGVSRLDFGRTSLTNTGLQRFKLGWGAEEQRLGYLRYDCRAQTYTTADDQSSSWQSHLFRHVPDPFGRLVGRFLYRHSA